MATGHPYTRLTTTFPTALSFRACRGIFSASMRPQGKILRLRTSCSAQDDREGCCAPLRMTEGVRIQNKKSTDESVDFFIIFDFPRTCAGENHADPRAASQSCRETRPAGRHLFGSRNRRRLAPVSRVRYIRQIRRYIQIRRRRRGRCRAPGCPFPPGGQRRRPCAGRARNTFSIHTRRGRWSRPDCRSMRR